MRTLLQKTVLTFLTCLISGLLFSYEQKYTDATSGDTIQDGVHVEDTEYEDMTTSSTWFDDYHNASSKALIQLGINHDYPFAVLTDFDLVYVFDIEWYDEDGNSQVEEDVCLRVGYDPLGSVYYEDISSFVVNGAHKVSVNFKELREYDSQDPCGGTIVTSFPNNVFLQATIIVERYYIGFDPTQNWADEPIHVFVDSNDDGKDDFIEIRWGYVEGAEFYDLEWTYINNYTGVGTNVKTAAQISFNERAMELNSTRISTTDQRYRIPMVYDRGFIVYRVRGVSKGGPEVSGSPTFNHWVFGKWSTAGNLGGPTGTLNDFASTTAEITGAHAHDEEKNWQHIATYAEEGKRKDVISYYDGTMRNRQMVTLINSDDHIVVGQTFYDFQGREAIQTLPVPLHENHLAYREQFNKDELGNELTKEDFDLDGTITCEPEVLKLSVLDGAGLYYSANNPNQSQWQAYVPEADGYAYTQTKYLADNTGRIRTQTGVGEIFSYAQDRSTKYFYGTPTQEELDRLFGPNVGYSVRYKKHMTVDANKQVSVQYLDAHGRVIATSLAGEKPENMEELKDEFGTGQATTGGEQMQVNLLGNSATLNNNQISADSLSIVYGAEILVSTAGTNDFNYTLDIPVYSDTCLNEDLEPVVQLMIGLLDECATEEFEVDGPNTNLNTILGVANIGGASPINAAYGPIEGLTANLDVGEYTVYKDLIIDMDALNYYAENYIDLLQENCIVSLDEFIAYQDSMLGSMIDCDVTCEDCVASLDEFFLESSEFGSIPEQETDPGYELYWSSYDDCMLPCQGLSLCATSRNIMLNDVSPQGQYGEFDADYNASDYPLSVYNTSNGLPSGDHFQSSGLEYFDEDGEPSLIPVDAQGNPAYTGSLTMVNGEPFITPNQLQNLSDFVQYWQPSWAETLLELHPEYCYLSFCEDFDATYTEFNGTPVSNKEFEEILTEIETFSSAANHNIHGQNVNLTDLLSGSSVLYDPFFNSTLGSAYVSDMVAKLNDYINSMSMTQSAAFVADCATLYGSTSCTGTYANNDEAWNNYKMFYISAKQEIVQKARQEYAITNGCFNGCIGSEDMNFAFTPDFWIPIPIPIFSGNSGFWDNSAPYDLCSFNNFFLYKNKQARFPDAGSLFNLTGDDEQDVNDLSTQANYEYYQLTGLCPLAVDIQNFLNGVAQDNALMTNNNPISNYGGFTQDLYEIMKDLDGYFGSNYEPYEIVVQENGTELTLGFENNSTPGNCEFVLNILNPNYQWIDYPSNWQIEYMGNMQIIDNNNFTIQAFLNNGTTLTMEGTSLCFDLLGCDAEFDAWLDEQCESNVIAKEITALMSALAASGDLNDPSTDVMQAPYNLFIANIIDVFGGTWDWETVSSGSEYELTNGTETFTIEIQSISFAPDFVLNIAPNPQGGANNGLITWIDGSGNTITDEVKIELYSTPFSLGECGVIESYTCSAPEQKNREALEQLVSGVLDGSITGSTLLNPFSYFSNNLQNYLGSGSYFASLKQNSTTEAVIEIKLHEHLDCEIELEIVQNWQNLTFSDIETIVGFYAVDNVGSSNTQLGGYDFVIHAVSTTGDLMFLEGKSCFPIANCDNCYECGPTQYTAFWRYYTTYEHLLTELNLTGEIVSESDFAAHTVVSNCMQSYFDYLNELIAAQEPIDPQDFVNIDAYCPRVDCDLDYSDYQNLVTANEESDYYLTEEEFLTTHSLCIDAYIRYFVAEGPTGVLTIEEFCGEIPFIPECEPFPLMPINLPEVDEPDPCTQFLNNLIDYQANHDYELYKESLVNEFIANYKRHIMLNATETLEREYLLNEYQYTLYYYDQAGNLVQTIPPKGVDPLPLSALNDVATERDNDQKITLPGHTYRTQYFYNSLNQLVEQTTPDTDGPSNFYYDALGRLVVSQNPKQAAFTDEAFSYTLYDELGRVVEVGQIEDVGTMNQSIAGATGPFEPSHPLYDWLNNGVVGTLPTKREVVQTHYDAAFADQNIAAAFSTAVNPADLRNRIAHVTYQVDFDWNPSQYDNALHYSYDIHGNVREMIQENNLMATMARRFTQTVYQYDLISGNVHKVSFQNGKIDALHHRYWYDADNRITHTFTSIDHIHWDRDAKYFYYEHGPLARTEIGHNKVQGIDHAYTLQGWIKGVNSNTLKANRDQGKDANLDATGNLNRYIATDEYGYTLGYYQGDYAAISTPTQKQHFEAYTQNNSNFNNRSLYNGNIGHMVTAIKKFDEMGQDPVQAMLYKYDQLNRLVNAQSYTSVQLQNNEWDAGTLSNQYATSYSYDLNGNIYNLTRNGYDDTSPLEMDDISYSYATGTNRLMSITDSEDNANYYENAIKYGTWGYDYDEIGQLIEDEHDEIAEIEWTVNHKVRSITRESSSEKSDLEFFYDGMGHRVAKVVKPRPGGTPSTSDQWTWTFYQMDAQGNTLARYEATDEQLQIKERIMYGSSRIGIITKVEDIPMIESICGINVIPSDGGTPVLPGGAGGLGNTGVTIGGHIVIDIGNPPPSGTISVQVDHHAIHTPMDWNTSGNIGEFAESLVHSINGNAFSSGYRATKMTTQRNIVIGIESLTKFNFGQTLPELEFYVDAVNYVDLIVQPSFGNCNAVYEHTLGNKHYELSNHLGNVLVTVTDKKLPEVLTNVEVMNDEFEVDGDQLGWYFDPTATPSGNYDVAVVNGSMTVEGEQDDHIRKNVFFADGQSYDIAINVLNYSGSIILNFTSENGGLTSWQMVNSTGIINVNNLIGDGTNAYIDFSFLGTASIELDYITITSDEEMIYHADVSSANDYYAFGMQMPGRNHQTDAYRYGFQGQEKDDEVRGSGNSINYKYRMHDPRIGRFFAVDPYEASYTSLSTYSFVGNNPITNIEVDGGWWFNKNKEDEKQHNPGRGHSQYSYKMSNVRAVAGKSNSIANYIPYVGNIMAMSIVAQKSQDPTMKVDKGDIAAIAMAGYFKGTRVIIKSLGALKGAARAALDISENIVTMASNIANNPELAESFVELEVMRYFNGVTSESGNSIGSLRGDNEKGYTTKFHFSSEFVSELETNFGKEFDNVANHILGDSDMKDSKVYNAFRNKYIETSVENHLQEMFDNKKKEITKEFNQALDKVKE